MNVLALVDDLAESIPEDRLAGRDPLMTEAGPNAAKIHSCGSGHLLSASGTDQVCAMPVSNQTNLWWSTKLEHRALYPLARGSSGSVEDQSG